MRAAPYLHGPGRWRIATLVLVHLAIAVHIIHWKLAGTTLSSIEFSSAALFTGEGVATAALFVFGLVLVVTLLFGRFFCAWGCHMLAFQFVDCLSGTRHGRCDPARMRRSHGVLPGLPEFLQVRVPVRRAVRAGGQRCTRTCAAHRGMQRVRHCPTSAAAPDWARDFPFHNRTAFPSSNPVGCREPGCC